MSLDKKVTSSEQIRAINLIRRKGLALAESNPEIADFYRQGLYQGEIARRYLPEEVEINLEIAKRIVTAALEILLSEDERKEIAFAHRRRQGLVIGHQTLSQGKGIHALTLEQRAENARRYYPQTLGKYSPAQRSAWGERGSKKGGESCYRQGKGIFSLTREQRAELGRIRGRRTYEARIGIHTQSREEKREAVRKGLLVQGKILYSDEEKKALVELANDPPYQHPEGARQAGKPNYEKIREKMLDEFGVERTVSSLKTMYYRINREQRPRA